MSITIWNIIQRFSGSLDMSSLNDITNNPAMIGDCIPFMVATLPSSTRENISWTMNETFSGCTYAGTACQMEFVYQIMTPESCIFQPRHRYVQRSSVGQLFHVQR
jgi:hypothetical protein